MLFRMIRGVLFHQKGKMLLIAVTIALGASLATGMLNVVLGVEEKVNKDGREVVLKKRFSYRFFIGFYCKGYLLTLSLNLKY